MRLSARHSRRKSRTRPRLSLHSVFPLCRMRIRSSFSTAAPCRLSARMMSCSPPTRSIRKSTTSRTERAVRNNGKTSDARTRRPQRHDGRQAQQKSEKDAWTSYEIYSEGLRRTVCGRTDLHSAVGCGKRGRLHVPQKPDRRLYFSAAAAGISGVYRSAACTDEYGGDLSHRHCDYVHLQLADGRHFAGRAQKGA